MYRRSTAEIREISFENWPDPLKALSMPTCSYAMSKEDLVAFGSSDPGFRQELGLKRLVPFSQDLHDWIDASLDELGGHIFLRTSYGSFRENPFSYTSIEFQKDAVAVLRWLDSRILFDIRARLFSNEALILLARQWRDIPLEAEFRLFIRSGEVVGITPYHSNKYHSWIASNAMELNLGLRRFAVGALEHIQQDPVVMDVWVRQLGHDFDCELIELTPFVEQVDCGLFQGLEPHILNGAFRYRTSGGISELR